MPPLPPSRRRHLLRSAAAWLALCLPPALAAAQVVLERPEVRDLERRRWQDQYRTMQNAVRDMPKVDVRRVDEVFLLRLRDAALTLDVPLPEWVTRRGGQYRVELDALPGATYVQLSNVPAFHRPGRPGAAGPPVGSLRVFALSHCGMPDPDTLTTLAVQSGPTSFSLDHATQSVGGHRTVRLVEQRNPDLPGGNTVQLWVNQYGGGRIVPLNLSLRSRDFAALVRDHPREVEAHVRPLLARLGQEQLFAPDPTVVRQVLREYWPADEPTGRRVAALLPDLDHADYRVRERTLGRLVELGDAGAAVLLRLDRAGFSPGRNLMIDRALDRYPQLAPADAERLRADRRFLLDCLYSEDLPVRTAAIRELRKLTGRQDLRFDPQVPSAAERFAAARALRDQLTPAPATRPATRRTGP